MVRRIIASMVRVALCVICLAALQSKMAPFEKNGVILVPDDAALGTKVWFGIIAVLLVFLGLVIFSVQLIIRLIYVVIGPFMPYDVKK